LLTGELVNLRAADARDASIVHHWFNDPAVMRGWGWSASARSLQSVARQLEEWLAQEDVLGRPAALIAEALDGSPVGLVVLRVDRPEARSFELSLLVGEPSLWGKGIGADMVQTILEACFAGWGVHRVGVRVEEDNDRALALYRRAGFLQEGRMRQAAFRDGRHADILLLSRLGPEWLKDEA
jgi:RimJ/RimL family protein N-acetyltransferase